MLSFHRHLGVGLIAAALAVPCALAESAQRTSVGVTTSGQHVRDRVPFTSPRGATPTLRGADAIEKAPSGLQEMGIGWLGLTRTSAGARLGLYSPAGIELGAFTVRQQEGEGRTLAPEWLDGRFEDARALTLRVWSETRRGLLDHLPLGAEGGNGLRSVSEQSTTCNTSYIYYSGLHIGATRSIACERATLDVSGRCSNSACWGCCRFLECDCACLVGDFDCVCTRGGNACALEGCEYQIIPDPETCEPTSGGGTGSGSGGWDPDAGGGSGGGTTCVDVYCNGSYSGQACGSTTEQIVAAAWDMC